MNRNFVLDYSSLGISGNRFSDTTPIRVARRVAQKLFNETKTKNISFCIRGTTKDSKKKKYHYNAKLIDKKIFVNSKPLTRGGAIDEKIINTGNTRGYLYYYDITLEEYIYYILDETQPHITVPYIESNSESDENQTIDDLKSSIMTLLNAKGCTDIALFDSFVNFNFKNRKHKLNYNHIDKDIHPLLTTDEMKGLCKSNCFMISLQ